MKGIIGERRENEWEISERETEHEKLLSLGNEQGVVEREVGRGMGWLGDGHWGGHLMGWAQGVMLYVGKSNSNKKLYKKKTQTNSLESQLGSYISIFLISSNTALCIPWILSSKIHSLILALTLLWLWLKPLSSGFSLWDIHITVS